jgi:hypothetical protein
VVALPRGEARARRREQLAHAIDPRRAIGLLGEAHRLRIVDQDRDPVGLARDLPELDGGLEEHDEGRGGRTGAKADHRRASPASCTSRCPPGKQRDRDDRRAAQEQAEASPRCEHHPAVLVEVGGARCREPHREQHEGFGDQRTDREQRTDAECGGDPTVPALDRDDRRDHQHDACGDQAVAESTREQDDVHVTSS